jgi:hypothetical protein
MNIFKRVVLAFTRYNEIESFVANEYRLKALKKIEDDKHRINLCREHRQESQYIEFSRNDCCYCKIKRHNREIEMELERLNLTDTEMLANSRMLDESEEMLKPKKVIDSE